MISSLLHSVFLETLSLQQLYFQWENAGIFDFFLPALLIFAVVFGILSSTRVLGGNRGINVIISVAIALLAIRAPIVSQFFTTVFPNFGIGIAIVVMVVILMGLFITKGNFSNFSNTLMWGGLGVAIIIAVVTLNQFDWFGSSWWQDNWTTIIFVVILVLIIAPLLLKPDSADEKAKRRAEHGTQFLAVRPED